MIEFKKLPKLTAGDNVAVVSLSSSLAGIYTDVFNAGIKALEDQFKLKTVIYDPTTNPSASFQSKVDALHAAFGDTHIKAIIATIGGETESNIIPLLNAKIIKNNPKAFFGFSDDTHLHNYLWKLGVPSYYGGSVMTQYAYPGGMDSLTARYLRFALFGSGEQLLEKSDVFSDHDALWGQPGWNTTKPQIATPPALWDGEEAAEGILWGGCIDTFRNLDIPSVQQLEGVVLAIESSEDMPDAEFITSTLNVLGEKDILGAIAGVLVGIAKTNTHLKPHSPSESARYRHAQAKAIIQTVRRYNQNVPIVQNIQFGHTDPQIVLPLGRRAKIIPLTQQIFVDYT